MALFPALNRQRRGPGARCSCVGLDLGDDRVRLAVLRRRRGGLRLELLDEQVFGHAVCAAGQIGDFELLAQGCRQLLRRHAVDAALLASAIPAASVDALRLTLPAGSDQAQRLAQVRAQLRAYRPSAADETALDYLTLGPAPASPADVQVLAVAAPALLVEDRLALAEALDMDARAILVGEWSTADFLRDGKDGAVLHLGTDGCWLSPRPGAWQALAWRPPCAQAALLHELAPLLRNMPSRLLLTGDAAGLDAVAAALRKYAGVAAAIAALPGRIGIASEFAAACMAPRLPAFHRALALAAGGLS